MVVVWQDVQLGLVAQARYATTVYGQLLSLHDYFFKLRGIREFLVCMISAWCGVD